MRIYLWSALRIVDLRMRVLRKRDLITDLRCLLTRQEDVGQVLVWPKEKNEELVEKRAVPIIQDVRLNFWIDRD
jgi:hypothetical protein